MAVTGKNRVCALEAFRYNSLPHIQKQLRKEPLDILGEWQTDKTDNKLFFANAFSNIEIIWQLHENGEYLKIPPYIGILPELDFEGYPETKQNYLKVCSKALQAVSQPLIEKKEHSKKILGWLKKFAEAYPYIENVMESYLKLLLIHKDFVTFKETYRKYCKALETRNKEPDRTIRSLYHSLEFLKQQETKVFINSLFVPEPIQG